MNPDNLLPESTTNNNVAYVPVTIPLYYQGHAYRAGDRAEALFAVLRSLKRPVRFMRVPDESHELTRAGSPQHRVTRFEAVLEWFDRYLKPTSH